MNKQENDELLARLERVAREFGIVIHKNKKEGL